MSEFSIYCFSNTQKNSTNTLSHFTNYFPKELKLNPYKYNYVALEEIGFHNRENNKKLSSSEPSFIIMINVQNWLEPSSFLESLGYVGDFDDEIMKYLVTYPIYLKDLTPSEVVKSFEIAKYKIQYMSTLIGPENYILNEDNYPFHMEENSGVLRLYSNLTSDVPLIFHQFYILINKDVAEWFNFEFTTNPIKVGENLMHGMVSILDNYSFEIKATKAFNHCERKFINVICDQIRPRLFNEQYIQSLKQIELPDSSSNYLSYEFTNLEFVPLLSNELYKISIELKNQCDNYLDLQSGIPTYLKLRFKEMDFPLFHINLNSQVSNYFEKTNTSYCFKNFLPRALELSDEWQFCLSSFSSPIEIFLFSQTEKEPEITVEYVINEEMQSHVLKVSKLSTSYLDIVDCINNFLQLKELGKLEEKENGNLFFNFSRYYCITLPYPINIILGFLEDISLKTDSIIGGKYENFVKTEEKNIIEAKFSVYDMEKIVKPPYFLVYCNIMDPVITGEHQSQLLRIIHYDEENVSRNRITKEFIHKNYFNLSHTRIQEIEIEIRSVDGNYIHFQSHEPVMLGLEFIKKKMFHKKIKTLLTKLY